MNQQIMRGLGRRDFLKASALGAAHGHESLGESVEHTNLLFVLVDQWRSSAFWFGTDELVSTPNINKLASQGARWTRAYASNPLCTPNRACILTGRYAHQTGMMRNGLQLPPDETCWPEIFRAAGYETQYIGKWHLDGEDREAFVPSGWRRRGFNKFEGFNTGHTYHRPYGFDDLGVHLRRRYSRAERENYYEPTAQTDSAIRFMQEQGEEPFVCFLSWGPPHNPFKPPPNFRRYEPGDITLRGNVPSEDEEKARNMLAGYYGLCESLDHEMGRLMAYLEESGLDRNTLVVFTSDHGELAGSHGKFGKSEFEDESLRVPLLMRLPRDIPAGTVVDTLTGSVDLMPTILSLCGLAVPDSCAGCDLSGAMLSGRTTPQVESVYCEGASPRIALLHGSTMGKIGSWRTIVTKEQYKLTVRVDYSAVYKLHDLQEDELELENLATDPDFRSTRSKLLGELVAWGRETGDVFPARPSHALKEYPDPDAPS